MPACALMKKKAAVRVALRKATVAPEDRLVEAVYHPTSALWPDMDALLLAARSRSCLVDHADLAVEMPVAVGCATHVLIGYHCRRLLGGQPRFVSGIRADMIRIGLSYLLDGRRP